MSNTVVIEKEGNVFVALSVESTCAAQGATEEEARSELLRLLAAQTVLDHIYRGDPLDLPDGFSYHGCLSCRFGLKHAGYLRIPRKLKKRLQRISNNAV